LSFHRGLDFVADCAPFPDGATPGVNRNIGRKGRVAFVWRAANRVRRQEKFHAFDVRCRCAVSLVHVTAGNPSCTRRHANLVNATIVAYRGAEGVRTVEEIIAGERRIVPARVAHTVVNAVVPVEIVIGVDSVPTAIVRP
jgi:hypothetical protein